MSKTVLGVFHDKDQAEEAILKLGAMGNNPKEISIVMQDKSESLELAQDTGTTVAESAVSGATAGGLIGALAGLLIGTGVIPGLGALLIGGPIAAALGLSGAVATTISGAVTGAVAGGLIGALTGLGVSSEDAKVYEQSVREGGILVMVPAREGYDYEVADLMRDYGATQVKSVDNTPPLEFQEYQREAAYYSDIKRGSSVSDDETTESEDEVVMVPVKRSTTKSRLKKVKP